MASHDTVIFLIVDYHAAIGGQDPRGPIAYAPVYRVPFLPARARYMLRQRGWLGGWVACWVMGVCHMPVLYQNG